MNDAKVVDLLAGHKTSGEPVMEEILIDPLGENLARVTATPCLVLGIAAGDVLRIDHSSGSFEIVRHGGNLAVHVYGPHVVADKLIQPISVLGGTLDSRAPELTVFTVPVKEGFQRIEKLLNDHISRAPKLRWYYGNVYGADGETPLSWWDE